MRKIRVVDRWTLGDTREACGRVRCRRRCSRSALWVAARGLLARGCAADAPGRHRDGTATALDVDHAGRVLSTVKSGNGVDIIAYDSKRGHLYLPGDESATMAIIGVSAKGVLSVLGVVPTVKDAHCVTTDEQGIAYVCDPRGGQLLVVRDSYPAAGK